MTNVSLEHANQAKAWAVKHGPEYFDNYDNFGREDFALDLSEALPIFSIAIGEELGDEYAAYILSRADRFDNDERSTLDPTERFELACEVPYFWLSDKWREQVEWTGEQYQYAGLLE